METPVSLVLKCYTNEQVHQVVQTEFSLSLGPGVFSGVFLLLCDLVRTTLVLSFPKLTLLQLITHYVI